MAMHSGLALPVRVRVIAAGAMDGPHREEREGIVTLRKTSCNCCCIHGRVMVNWSGIRQGRELQRILRNSSRVGGPFGKKAHWLARLRCGQ